MLQYYYFEEKVLRKWNEHFKIRISNPVSGKIPKPFILLYEGDLSTKNIIFDKIYYIESTIASVAKCAYVTSYMCVESILTTYTNVIVVGAETLRKRDAYRTTLQYHHWKRPDVGLRRSAPSGWQRFTKHTSQIVNSKIRECTVKRIKPAGNHKELKYVSTNWTFFISQLGTQWQYINISRRFICKFF